MRAENLGPYLRCHFNQEHGKAVKDMVEKRIKAVLQQNMEPVHKI